MLALNGLLDTSAPVTHEARVTHRRKTTGKNTSYYISVGSWHPGEATIEISISSSLYSRISEGKEISVTTSTGALGWERLLRIIPPSGD